MDGFSVALPMTYDKSEDGVYTLNKTILDTIRQNLRTLLETVPGERVMIPDFGVGLRKFLFEPDVEQTRDLIRTRILSQTKAYLSFIRIDKIEFTSEDTNILGIRITYTIPSINIKDALTVQPFP